jgi:2-oxoglutarate dehydrogenase E2 component (dihydrolipoamide succinyltransferase)
MSKYKLLLPKMGESVAEATIIKWIKNPGDYIEADETVMEIATDKVDSDVPSPVSGKLLERFYNENDIVQVGAVIAIIETGEPEEVKEQQISPPAREERYGSPEAAAPFVKESKSPVQSAYEPVKVEYKPEPAPEAHLPGQTKQPVFEEQSPEQPQPVPYTEQLEQRNADKTENNGKNQLRFYSPLVKNIAAQERISNDELEQIPGTGAEGRLTKDDLLAYIQNRSQPKPEPQYSAEQVSQAPVSKPAERLVAEPSPVPISGIPQPGQEAEIKQPQPVNERAIETAFTKTPVPEPIKQAPAEAIGKSVSGGDEIIEMDRMRRLIADHMVMSKHTSPHVTSFVEADVTNIVMWREKIKSSFEKREGEKITFTPIFIEAVARAIKDLPMINIQVRGTQIIKKKDINIGMATSLPGGNLIVPVIKRADELSLLGLTKAVNDLASRARINKLKPDDVQGGTFTITNVGSFGNVMGTPIINQPQVAILAVGAIKKKPAVIETLQGDMIGIRHMMFLSLSYDHRVVDGALGGSFVRRVADYLENWETDRNL